MKSEWADYAAVQVWCGNLSRNELTRNLSGNIQPQLSQLTKPVWTDLGTKRGISVFELLSISKKERKKKCRWGMVEFSPKILTSKEKATTTTYLYLALIPTTGYIIFLVQF